MSIYKNQDTGTWYVICWFTDWKGERKQKCKRGFPTKRAAADWEREFLMQKQANIDMTLDSFVKLYEQDVKGDENEYIKNLRMYISADPIRFDKDCDPPALDPRYAGSEMKPDI